MKWVCLASECRFNKVSNVYTLTSKPWRLHALNAAVLLLFFCKSSLAPTKRVYTHTLQEV